MSLLKTFLQKLPTWIFRLGQALLLPVSLAAQPMPDMSFLPGAGPTRYLDPAGYFEIELPASFVCQSTPKSLACLGPAILTLNVNQAPTGATATLVALSIEDDYKAQFGKDPSFSVKRTNKSVDGRPAVVQTIRYSPLGNVSLSKTIRDLIVVWGTNLLKMRLDCDSASCGQPLVGMDQIDKSMKLVPLDAKGKPLLGKLKRKDSGKSDPNQAIQKLLKDMY